MHPILRRIKELLFPSLKTSLSSEELESLFRVRYQHFRTLLTANNNALGAMAELEQALISGQTYSLALVRARTTVVLVSVYKMVQSMIALADGRYRDLEKIFERISKEVDAIIERTPAEREGPWILPLADITRDMADQVGEKMANLGEAARLPGIRTPGGFVLTASAGRYLMAAGDLGREINRLEQQLDPGDLEKLYSSSAAIQGLISGSSMPGDLEELMLSAYARLEGETQPGILVAMRSSATGEDLAGASFAGQYHTELNVDREFLGYTYKEVVASKFTSRAILYRLKKGYRHADIEMCVGCLAMIEASVSGVTYTREPTDPGSGWLVINVVAGAARKVVDGTVMTRRLLVSRQDPRRIVLHHGTEKGEQEALSGPLLAGLLSPALIEELARVAITLEGHFGAPQDIEWSIDKQGQIYVLQTRPMMVAAGSRTPETAPETADPDILFRGEVTASPGIACGPVFVVSSMVDILRFPQDAVLVVEHPLPDWAPLLSRAVALVATTGSEAGHLATVAREFGIPALFGLPDSVRGLAEGTLVTVDSKGRRIYRGRREDLLRLNVNPPPDLMAGSPVQAVLKQVLERLTPLNLTDPRSPTFKSSWCETLHDITRFCHEKAVTEMFDFGGRYHFSERAARRLMGDVPLDWWVINLADGFRDDAGVDKNFVHINAIASRPMLAIWEGISAFPWGGPPVVDMKGMGSILFQSIMQPGLDPAVASPMTAKNYFLISRNFCNLSVRLGYHFAMIEAYLSDLLTESYVTFTFKGGAADGQRKASRIVFLAEILEKYGFRIELRGDALTARVEKRPMDLLLQYLKILGYLVLHARQLDMIMNNPERVNGYREKFRTEIDSLLRLQPSRPVAENG
ncbi:MAG: PEP/pyruvate-binding domain-containing protein [Desulfocapsaceae bacterium]|nr:PEP/pyruvate-binding domain-containing protein [Desulfocapsaceae bacterium]